MSHAKLSPSASERWFACPGSVVLSADMPSKSSAYAEEGTLAHAVAERWLLNANNQVAVSHPEADAEMMRHVETYVTHVLGLHGQQPDNKLFVEKQVKITDNLWGTADAIVWEPRTKTLYVADLKFGAGVGVEVSNNLQLKLYALAALLTMKFPAETVNVGIVQPRFNHPDGPVRSKDFDVTDLIDFHADVLDAVASVEQAHNMAGSHRWDDAYLVPTEKGCRWCPAAPKCPKLHTKAQELAKQVFAPGLPYDPKQLAETLTFLDILEGWIKNTRQFAYEEAEQGRQVPGWKLVEKRATRKWKDIEAAKAYFGNAPEFYTEPQLITPAQAEKLMEKEERSKLDSLTIKESSGHTLVPESDKREAVRLDAKAAFENA